MDASLDSCAGPSRGVAAFGIAPLCHTVGSMPTAPHIETHFEASETVRDVVIGMADGLTVPFALAAVLTGTAAATSHLVVIAGKVQEQGLKVTVEAYPYGAASTAIGAKFLDPENLARVGMTYGSVEYLGERLDESSYKELRARNPSAVVRISTNFLAIRSCWTWRCFSPTASSLQTPCRVRNSRGLLRRMCRCRGLRSELRRRI